MGVATVKSTPQHLGVIMDGNRRWAVANGLTESEGHTKGCEVFGELLKWCLFEEIPHLSVYVFSTENAKRSKEEIAHIFSLVSDFFEKSKECSINQGITYTIIGNKDILPSQTAKLIQEINKGVGTNAKLNVQFALGYGGRDEIVRAVKAIGKNLLSGSLSLNDIDEDLVSNYLDTQNFPDVDLLIRTGAAHRLSNFMLWQTHYSEICFSDKLWPSFSESDFREAINFYVNNYKTQQGK